MTVKEDVKILKLFFNFSTVAEATKKAIAFFEDFRNLSYTAAYHRIRRAVKRLVEKKLLKEQKARKNAVGYAPTRKALDLLAAEQNSNSRKTSSGQSGLLLNSFRFEAVKLCKRKKMLSEVDKQHINDYFTDYLDDCEKKKIILRLKEEYVSTFNQSPELMILNYKTRFTDEKRLKFNIKKYHAVFDDASSRYKRAVHLVLTTDPKRFRNLYEANRHFSKAFNRFMSYLTKIEKKRPQYIVAYEFTKSGLMHAHVVIFGKPYLMHKELITREWERCGQGTYNYIYSLKCENGRWVYARKRPKDARDGESADDYLKKYLIKAQYNAEAAALYWVFNKRFFTHSRSLAPQFRHARVSIGIYEFLKSMYDYDVWQIYQIYECQSIYEEPELIRPKSFNDEQE